MQGWLPPCRGTTAAQCEARQELGLLEEPRCDRHLTRDEVEDFSLWRMKTGDCAWQNLIASLFFVPVPSGSMRPLPLFSQETTKKHSLTALRCRGPSPTVPSGD